VSPLQQTDSAAPAENGAARFGHGRRRLAIVETLLAEVFQGRIRAGDRLVMEDLSARLGVSPTPVREALITLAGIGIVEFLPNRGAVVRRFTATDIRELCQVRRALECEAVRLACGRIELAELHDLAGEFRRVMAIQKLTIAFIENCRGLDSRTTATSARSWPTVLPATVRTARAEGRPAAGPARTRRSGRHRTGQAGRERVDSPHLSTDADEVMPPPDTSKNADGRAERDLLRRWVAAGAEYQPHWSFIAPQRPPLPAVKNAGLGAQSDRCLCSGQLDSTDWSPRPKPTAARWPAD
jgi:DNA-binding transcriptional regulator YhcF (GntR family)